jgi:hypothetical protein
MIDSFTPTPYPDVNAFVHGLFDHVRLTLGSRFVGMYLDGSLASGGFDQDSDIDFIVVTDEELSQELFTALQTMHDRLAEMDSWWAIQLEGSYFPQRVLRRYDPSYQTPLPNIERGKGERLKLVRHEAGWVIHRYILRERGIILAGPPPQTLVDPVLPDDLRRAMLSMLPGWASQIFAEPIWVQMGGYQSYIVLSLCRVLYTLQVGDVASKQAAARWAQETLGQPWAPLIERAWIGRHDPGPEAAAEDISGTLDFLHYALGICQQYGLPPQERG